MNPDILERPTNVKGRSYYRRFKGGPWEKIDFQVYLHFWAKAQVDPRIVDGFSFFSCPA